MDSVEKNHTYNLVKLNGKRALKNIWMFRLKQRENSVKSRYKARLVIKDLNQPKGVDVWEIFSCHLDVINLSGTRISR